METEVLNSNESALFEPEVRSQEVSTDKPFIQANTIEGTFEEVKNRHVIPVFIKDNEPVISHSDFIEITLDAVSNVFHGESILKPSIRLSHPIKGRIPEARLKPANELLEHEKTLYYERMAFIIEVPTIHTEIGGNQLSLTIGGIKAYNLDNLYSRKGADEHFKVFIGFQNKVCCNLCVWSDGYVSDLKVKNTNQLMGHIRTLIDNYNTNFHINFLNRLNDYSLTEHQFAHLIGRCRMYNHLPMELKNNISPLLLNDTQLGTVVKDFYSDHSFCRDEAGHINLWKLYNLFTSSNKSSYIDTFLDRSVNAFSFVDEIRDALEKKNSNWFLN
jgi:hypothetical protein